MFKVVIVIAVVAVAVLLFTIFRGQSAVYTPRMIEKKYTIDDAVLNSKDVMSVIDPVWAVGDIYGTLENYESSLEPFTIEQRYIHAIMWYSSEVNNGGHSQFYLNSTGIVWKNALQGLEAIGADSAADNLRKSFDVLGGEPSFDRSTRIELLENALEEKFEPLDKAFYELDQSIYERMLGFIFSNKDKFYFEGTLTIPDNMV